MSELKFCRICLDSNVRMHQIAGTEVQDVFEMLADEKLSPRAQEDCKYFACYICYGNLRNCQQLLKKLRKSEELLKERLLHSGELNSDSDTCSISLPSSLQNPLTVAKTETFETPLYNVIVKMEDQDAIKTEEVTVKTEPDDESR